MTAGYFWLTDTLVRYAMDRRRPLLMDWIIPPLTACFAPKAFLKTVQRAERTLCAMPHTRVTLCASYDGVTLTGHWFPVAGAQRVVLVLHGFRSSWCEGFGLIAPLLRDTGCSVLYAEMRAQGNSGGECMSFGALECYDVRDWLCYLAQLEPHMPRYLYGISMGASAAVFGAALDSQAISGLIWDCGFCSPRQVWEHFATTTLHLPRGLYAKRVAALFDRRLWLGASDLSAWEAVQHCHMPSLFVHGLQDTLVPPSMTETVYEASPATSKQLLLVPGAGHGMAYYQDPTAYAHALQALFARGDVYAI